MRRQRVVRSLLGGLVGFLCASLGAEPWLWPTPNTALDRGGRLEEVVQPTASGKLESGLYGGTRSGGSQFHEGLDIKPVRRDRKGEALDEVFCMAEGVVRHLSRQPGHSSYGRYVVVEHMEGRLPVYSLYAHLATIDGALRVGGRVTRGQVLGILGRSSSSAAIPKDRAHLHWEVGIWLTRDFQRWYQRKKFGSPNQHGAWNGMNLVGLDPLVLYRDLQAGRVDDVLAHVRALPTAVRVRVRTTRIPDFVERYPALLTQPLPANRVVAGFEMTVSPLGVPTGLTPLTDGGGISLKPKTVEVLWADASLLRAHRCKHLAIQRRGAWEAASDLEDLVDLLFGF